MARSDCSNITRRAVVKGFGAAGAGVLAAASSIRTAFAQAKPPMKLSHYGAAKSARRASLTTNQAATLGRKR